MSVWVMISPLMIAVALTTDGMLAPNNWGFSGSLSAVVLFAAPDGGGVAAPCANAVPATARLRAAAPRRARVEKSSEPAVTFVKSLAKTSLKPIAVYPRPLNAGLAAPSISLAAKSLQSHSERESAPLAEVADALIVAAPG